MVKKLTVFSLIALLALSVVAPQYASAHGSHTNSAGENRCQLRADVTGDEANELTGGRTSQQHNSGEWLTLGGSTGGDHGVICTFGLIRFIAGVLFAFLLVIATLMIAVSAFMFVTAGGDPGKLGKAKTYLLWSVIGLVVAAVARLIPRLVTGLIGITS